MLRPGAEHEIIVSAIRTVRAFAVKKKERSTRFWLVRCFAQLCYTFGSGRQRWKVLPGQVGANVVATS